MQEGVVHSLLFHCIFFVSFPGLEIFQNILYIIFCNGLRIIFFKRHQPFFTGKLCYHPAALLCCKADALSVCGGGFDWT